MVLPEIDVTAVSHKLVTHDLIKALKTEVRRFHLYLCSTTESSYFKG